MKPPWQARPQQFVTTAAPDHSQLRYAVFQIYFYHNHKRAVFSRQFDFR